VRQNIIGPRIRQLRREQDLTQAELAARCGRLGWDASENTITKIEKCFRCVTDRELVILVQALRVKMRQIFADKPSMF
jgi:transcriptional regulator with XRE-family HTH domain